MESNDGGVGGWKTGFSTPVTRKRWEVNQEVWAAKKKEALDAAIQQGAGKDATDYKDEEKKLAELAAEEKRQEELASFFSNLKHLEIDFIFGWKIIILLTTDNPLGMSVSESLRL